MAEPWSNDIKKRLEVNLQMETESFTKQANRCGKTSNTRPPTQSPSSTKTYEGDPSDNDSISVETDEIDTLHKQLKWINTDNNNNSQFTLALNNSLPKGKTKSTIVYFK